MRQPPLTLPVTTYNSGNASHRRVRSHPSTRTRSFRDCSASPSARPRQPQSMFLVSTRTSTLLRACTVSLNSSKQALTGKSVLSSLKRSVAIMSEGTQQEAKRGEKKQGQRGRGGGGSAKLRGLPTDAPEVRMSKTLTWVLRHGSQAEGLAMRPDGYVRVDELVRPSRLKCARPICMIPK